MSWRGEGGRGVESEGVRGTTVPNRKPLDIKASVVR